MKNKPSGIFIGLVEVANVGAMLASALKEKGIKVTVVTGRVSPYQEGMKYDVVMDFRDLKSKYHRFLKRLCYSLKFFLQHDVFIFMFGGSLLPHNLDLPILKLFHKKTLMWFHGSDIRHYESLTVAAKKAGINTIRAETRGRDLKA